MFRGESLTVTDNALVYLPDGSEQFAEVDDGEDTDDFSLRERLSVGGSSVETDRMWGEILSRVEQTPRLEPLWKSCPEMGFSSSGADAFLDHLR